MIAWRSHRPGGPRAVFLDRDGTVIRHVHYLHQPDQVELFPDSVSALRGWQEAGWRLVVLSNQSGVGRGLFSEDDLHRTNDRMRELLEAGGVFLDAIYCCPHAPQEECACRKPQPGMAQAAAEALGLVLARCCMVGDSDCDMELAAGLGIPGLRVDGGELTLGRLEITLPQL